MHRGLIPLACVLSVLSAASGPGSDSAPQPGAGDASRLEIPTDPAGRADLRPLPFFYDLYTFRGTGGSTAIVAAFAVEARNLETEEVGRGVRYRFDVSLVLADTALRSVSRTDDSVFVRVADPLSGEHLLFTHVQVYAPPSGTTLQRVIMTDATTTGIGQLYTSSFPIPDYRGSHLMLSDIALGKPDVNAGWKRGDVTLALLPTSQFPESAFDVYYEVYNLPAGNHYTTEIAVQPVDEAGGTPIADGRPVRLSFSGESAARPNGVLHELRRVEASLGKGHYRITVTVTDEDAGASASRSRFFHVRGWTSGTTLVTALPRERAWR